jgi:hypothetical protein
VLRHHGSRRDTDEYYSLKELSERFKTMGKVVDCISDVKILLLNIRFINEESKKVGTFRLL